MRGWWLGDGRGNKKQSGTSRLITVIGLKWICFVYGKMIQMETFRSHLMLSSDSLAHLYKASTIGVGRGGAGGGAGSPPNYLRGGPTYPLPPPPYNPPTFLYARLKNGRIMLYPMASVRPSVRPSVCKLFRFRVTPPTVYAWIELKLGI